MRIGLISKPEHCRPHVKAIKALGVKVEVFGGDPGLTIPSRVDVLMVRACSISHSAFGIAKAWERNGGKVFYIEGAKKAAEALKEWIDMSSLPDLISQMMDEYGWVHWYVLCKWSIEDRRSIGYTGYEEDIAALSPISPGRARTAITSRARARKWEKRHLSAANGGSPGRPIQVWARPGEKGQTLTAFAQLAAQKRGLGIGTKRPAEAVPPKSPIEPEESPILPKDTTQKIGAEIKDKGDSDTQALLDIMSDMDARGRANRRALEGRVQQLEKRARALEDRATYAAFRIAIEDRIKALEEDSGPVKSQSASHFDAIEDFKRKMSASGFRGTLTLEIS